MLAFTTHMKTFCPPPCQHRLAIGLIEHQQSRATLGDMIAIAVGHLSEIGIHVPIAIAAGAAFDQTQVGFESWWARPSPYGVIDEIKQTLHGQTVRPGFLQIKYKSLTAAPRPTL